MSKLYFRYGAMGSAKTLNLLAVAHNYEQQGKKVFLIKPQVDTRSPLIQSRAGLSRTPHLCPGPRDIIDGFGLGTHCVLVDEAQFLSPRQVQGLRDTAWAGTPVLCYGLRTDFRGQFFPGSRRLMEVADSIEEVKTTCCFCDKKATMNLRLVESQEQVLVGGDDLYRAACWACWKERQ